MGAGLGPSKSRAPNQHSGGQRRQISDIGGGGSTDLAPACTTLSPHPVPLAVPAGGLDVVLAVANSTLFGGFGFGTRGEHTSPPCEIPFCSSVRSQVEQSTLRLKGNMNSQQHGNKLSPHPMPLAVPAGGLDVVLAVAKSTLFGVLGGWGVVPS